MVRRSVSLIAGWGTPRNTSTEGSGRLIEIAAPPAPPKGASRHLHLRGGCVGAAVWITWGIAWGIAVGSSPLHAQPESTLDLIFLHIPPPRDDAWNGPAHRVIEGRVSRFDADALVFVTDAGAPQTVRSDQVDRVVPNWANEQAKAGHELVEQRDFRSAIPALEGAVRSGIPRWQQRLLIADLVRAVDAIGNTRSAGVLFLNLAASNPPPVLYADMPLCWTTREPDAALRAAAQQWLESDEPHAQLLGASWLSSGASRDQADGVLRRLENHSLPILAQLARMQRWRLAAPPETLARLPAWMAARDAMPGPLQLGPTEFLAERLYQVGQVEMAIGQWMRIVTQHQDRYHRWQAATGRVEAALQQSGNQEQAERFKAWIDQSPHY